jgi:hypothetical protein
VIITWKAAPTAPFLKNALLTEADACEEASERCANLFIFFTAPMHPRLTGLARDFSREENRTLFELLGGVLVSRGLACHSRPTVSRSRGPSGGRSGRMSRSQQDSWNVFGILENALGISGSQHSVPGRGGPPPRGELHDSRQRGASPSDADNVRRIRGQSERLSAFRGSPHLLPSCGQSLFFLPSPFASPPFFVRSSNCGWHSGSEWRRRRRTDELRGGEDMDCAGLQG